MTPRSTYVAGNISEERLERTQRNVRVFVERHGDDIVRPAEWGTDRDDPMLLWAESRVFVTRTDDPAAGEFVYVEPSGRNDDGELLVKALFPERDAVKGGIYHYVTKAATLVDRMAADGGWLEVRHFEQLDGQVNCPECGAFVSIARDHDGVPWAACTATGCDGALDIDDLIERDAVGRVVSVH